MSPPGHHSNWSKQRGKQLSYHLPPISIAFLSAPYADKEGNLYFHHEPLISENYEVVRAAKANGGKVIAMVGSLIRQDKNKICISRSDVDAIVIHPQRPQMAGVPHSDLWTALLPGVKTDPVVELSTIRLINRLAGITPERSRLDSKLAKRTVDLFMTLAAPENVVNFGVGLPEEVCYQLFRRQESDQFTFTTESGTYGGIPAPGMFFGAAIQPERIESSTWMFDLYASRLDIAVLGFLQVDSSGNVNVSKRGDSVEDFVGPGGFCDITEGARTIIFVGSWMIGGKFSINDGEVRIKRQGEVKFVPQVNHITFNAQQAIKSNKKVFYVTDVGVFRLTTLGVELCYLTQGIDLEKDILDGCNADIKVASEWIVI